MKRREFNAFVGTAVGAWMLNRVGVGASKPTGREQPNILFIMTDQQSAHMMSCTGNNGLKTPSMDRLAVSGTRFERAYACNPVCVPNRFSLQTGLMPSAIGMGENGDSKDSNVTRNMVEHSLGRLFQQAGYETVYGGKVHLPKGMNRVEDLGYRNLTRDSRQGMAETCARFIRAKHTRPFFLFASFINPHDICYMAINDHKRSQGQVAHNNLDSRICEGVLEQARKEERISDFVTKRCPALPANHAVPDLEPECIRRKYVEARPFRAYARAQWTETQWRLHRWAYCRLTESVDEKIGLLLDAVTEAGLQDNTLIVFTSDHGDMDGAHRMEHKSVLYEEAVRIPFIMRYPKVIPANTVNHTQLVSNGLDLLPTLCDYAGIDLPEGRQGLSLRALAEGRTVGWRKYVVVESQNGRMLRTDRFKYCIYDSGANREQLIDLKNDPGEMRNLAQRAEYKEILLQHRQYLREWVKASGDRIGADYV
jgi:arylsulfatase A-like enzyme